MTARYAVGDRLILRQSRRGREADEEVIVYKTGRKWGYAKPEGRAFPDVKFDLETGYEDGRGYASTQRVLTPEQDALEERRSAAVQQLLALGVELRFEARHHSAETLERVVEILSADDA